MQNAVTPNGTTPVFTRGGFLCGRRIEQAHPSVYFHVTNTIHFRDFVNSRFAVSVFFALIRAPCIYSACILHVIIGWFEHISLVRHTKQTQTTPAYNGEPPAVRCSFSTCIRSTHGLSPRSAIAVTYKLNNGAQSRRHKRQVLYQVLFDLGRKRSGQRRDLVDGDPVPV